MNNNINQSIPQMIMLCGLPGSGKTEYAEAYKSNGYQIFSSDKIRKEICNDENDQSKNEEVFVTLHKRIRACLLNGQSCVYDATNISSKRRMGFLRELKNIICRKRCIVIATPFYECIRRSKLRDRIVPYSSIRKMYLNWNTPYYFEGWDEILLYYSNEQWKNLYTPYTYIEELSQYNQHNSHHTMTLKEHLQKTARLLSKENQKSLEFSGLLHDIGKPFTRSFVDYNGITTENAHYYQHDNVGAYDSLFFDMGYEIDKLKMSILINLHMRPYFWENDMKHKEKNQSKHKKLWGEQLYNDVMKLHEADRAAH